MLVVLLRVVPVEVKNLCLIRNIFNGLRADPNDILSKFHSNRSSCWSYCARGSRSLRVTTSPRSIRPIFKKFAATQSIFVSKFNLNQSRDTEATLM